MKRRTVIMSSIAVAAVVFAALIVGNMKNGTGSGPAANQKKTPQVRVVPAPRETISMILDLTGSVEPDRVAVLASPAEGPVAGIRAREGDRVSGGQALLYVGRKEGVDALIESLREEASKEQDNLDRTRRLVESDALPGEELDKARANLERARAQLVKAEETARDFTVTAPWSGVVSRVLVREGEYVSPRAGLMEIYDPLSLLIRASVPEKHAAEVSQGMPVEAVLDAFPGETMPGRVIRVHPYLDSRLRSRIIEIKLDKRDGLLPGMFARLSVTLRKVDEAIVLPLEALVSTPKGKAVFIIEDGKALFRPVKTGIEEGSRVEIVSGMEFGEKVVVAGREKLKDGASVIVIGGAEAGSGKPENKAGVPGKGKNEAEGGGK